MSGPLKPIDTAPELFITEDKSITLQFPGDVDTGIHPTYIPSITRDAAKRLAQDLANALGLQLVEFSDKQPGPKPPKFFHAWGDIAKGALFYQTPDGNPPMGLPGQWTWIDGATDQGTVKLAGEAWAKGWASRERLEQENPWLVDLYKKTKEAQ